MMLIPQTHNFGVTDNITQNLAKANYFPGVIDNSGIVAAASVTKHSPTNAFRGCPTAGQILGDRPMFASRMQSDVSGFNMYTGSTGPAATGAIPSPAAYGAPANPSHGFVPHHYGSSGIEHSPYYPALGPSGYETKAPNNGDMWAGGYGQAAPPYYQYDNFGAQYPYDSRYCGMDMNDGVRRKNATRESTNTLKAWLQEHKKNPYPTKGEKIMLAIITKMTLTQVSTWFANARRRLKKENKMTWVPKNRTNDSSNSSEDRRESEDKELDEKLDEDCSSDIDPDDHPLNGTKSDISENSTENKSSCQFQQDVTKPSSYETDVNDNSQPQPTDSPDSRYSGTNSHITDQNRLHHDNEQAYVPFEAQSSDMSHHRSIWSPIDSREQFRNYPEESRNMFNQGVAGPIPPNSLNHAGQMPNPNTMQPPQNFSHLQHSQQQTFPSNSSQHRYVTANTNDSPGSSTSHNIDPSDNSERRNDCRFTSPVTNLQNWVNGVFHGPESAQNSSSSEKGMLITSKEQSAEEATDLSATRNPFNYNNHYKHAPLTESKSLQYGPMSSSTSVTSYTSGDYYSQHRLLTKHHSANIHQSSSPYYQPGIDGTPPPSNQMAMAATQRNSTPKSCSLSPSELQHTNAGGRIPFHEVPLTDHRAILPPPPYAPHYHGEQYMDGQGHSTTPQGYSANRQGYMSPPIPTNNVQNMSTVSKQIMSPSSALTGSNSSDSSTVEYKTSQPRGD